MKLFTLLFFFLVTAHAQIKPVDQQYMSGENYLLNNGFESGRASWTQTGTATATLDQSIVRFGIQSYKIVASSQTVDLSQVVTKYAAQSGGQQGIVSVFIKNTNPLLKVCAVSNSVDTNCLDVLPNDEWREYAIPFVLSATNNGIRIKSASDSGTTYIDNAFVGVMPATMMPEVSQAQIAGEAYFAGTANCAWSRTSTTIGAFSTDADCPAPTISKQNIGSWQTTDADLPRITVNSLPAGEYKATFQVSHLAGVSDNGTVLAIYDGATTCYAQKTTVTTVANAATISCVFTYTSSGNRSFEIYAASASSSVTLNSNSTAPAGSGLKFILEYYPPKSKIYSGDTIYPHAQLLGKVNWATSANCVWSITGTTITNFPVDADCANPTVSGGVVAPSTKIPAIILPAGSSKGTYKFIATALFYGSPSSDSLCSYRFSDGTNNTSLQTGGNASASGGGSPVIIGEITYDSTLSSATTVQIQSRENSGNATACTIELNDNQEELNISVYYFPPKDNPIIGTFANVVTAPNIAKPKTCYYAFGGASATLASPTECTGTCVEVYDSCNAGTPPVNGSTARYDGLSFASGTWKANTFIQCKCQAWDTTTTSQRKCDLFFATGQNSWSTNSNGGYSVSMYTFSSGVSQETTYVNLECTADAL